MSTIKDRTGYYVKCEWCGKEVYQTKTQYNRGKHHYCSNECQFKFQHAQKFEFRKCEICGELYETKKNSTQRFCSQKCQGKWQSTQTGLLNPRNKLIHYTCENCGKEGLVKRKQYIHCEHHFCSDYCRATWYKNNVYRTPEWREKSRKQAVRILSKGQVDLNTKPQIIINNLLDDMNISYINEKGYVYYSVDNYLDKNNLIIEVMGDYWHGSPIKYKDKLNDVQRNRIGKDKAKHSYIKNNYGIEILYLWEDDIYNRLDLCRALIQLYILKKGLLNNYNSFNYYLSEDGNIILNSNIIKPYFEITEPIVSNVINA